MTMPNPPGRQTVSPGELIASEWGDAVWDQSLQRFTDTTARDAQFPAPGEGAECMTLAPYAKWKYRNGGWRYALADVNPVNSLVPPSVPNQFTGLRISGGTIVMTADSNGASTIPLTAYGAVFTVIATPGEDQFAPTVETFDYHLTYCQFIYRRNGQPVMNSAVRVNYLTLEG